MRSFKFSVYLASIALTSVNVCANTPPILPPDPVRFAAASDLIAVLPIESAVRIYGNEFVIGEEITRNALEWFRQQPNSSHDEILEQVLAVKIRLEVESEISAAVRDIVSALAEDYARRLSVQDIIAVKAFALTPHGKNFMRMQLEEDGRLIRHVSRKLYLQIFEKLPQLLISARESRKILKKVNREP